MTVCWKWRSLRWRLYFDWRDFLAHYEDEEEQPEEEGFEVVDVEDENDEILQALDRYFDEAAPTEEKEQ